MLGSHVVEQLLARGEAVRALVRRDSDTRWLRDQGVELAEGDLNKPDTLPAALAGCQVAYHCAARVGDWGSWHVFQHAILDATTHLLRASEQAGIERFLHVSSINVYGHPRLNEGQWLTEDDPLGRDLWWWDHYCRAKIEAEGLVRASSLAWTIVRPSWIYGPRDRNTLPRVLRAIHTGGAAVVGSGDNRLNIVYAADVADGVLRAATTPAALKRIYNLSSEGAIRQRDFLDAITDELGAPRITKRYPFWLAFTGGFLAECAGRLLRRSRPPHLTRYAVALIGRSTRFSIARAREELGWSPRMPPLEGLKRTLDWYRAEQASMSAANDLVRSDACPTSPTA